MVLRCFWAFASIDPPREEIRDMSSTETPKNRFTFPLEILSCLGVDLQEHSNKGIVFWVDSSLELLSFSQEVANDNAQYISRCMAEGLLKIANTDDFSSEKTFRFVIVQPYIFVEKTV